MPIIILSLLSPINDISTTFDPIPQFTKPLTYQESFKDVQKKLYPDLKPLELKHSGPQVFRKVIEIAKTEPNWEITVNEPGQLRLEAVATTSLLKFKDDIVIEVKYLENGSSAVNMRSRSRVGRSDLGANAKRIQNFFSKLVQKTS